MPRIVVLGAGITGLAAAHRMLRTHPGADVVVLEASERVGGVVGATDEGGFHVDWAANGFLADAPDTLELIRELGLEIEPADARAAKRYVYRHGGLRAVPTSPGAFLASPLLGPLGTIRALFEPFVPKGDAEGETVHAFLARRAGRAAADAFADVLVTGTTAGDARALSVQALFPRLVELEREHGSLLRGMMAAGGGSRGEDARTRPDTGGSGDSDRDDSAESASTAPRRGLATIRGGGLPRLTEALAAGLGTRVRVGARATRLEHRPGGGWRVHVHDRPAISAASVVLATPADVSAELLRPHAPDAADALDAIPYAPVRVFGLGYERIDVPHALDGFGFLVHPSENLRSLGVLWSSTIFPGRAPDGHVLLRVIAGGTRDPEMVDLSDEEALAAVRDDLRIAMGVTVDPVLSVQKRWTRGIPQYTLGHRARVAEAEAACARLGGLVLAGNAYRGVGINDCLRDANRAADLALAPLETAV